MLLVQFPTFAGQGGDCGAKRVNHINHNNMKGFLLMFSFGKSKMVWLVSPIKTLTSPKMEDILCNYPLVFGQARVDKCETLTISLMKAHPRGQLQQQQKALRD